MDLTDSKLADCRWWAEQPGDKVTINYKSDIIDMLDEIDRHRAAKAADAERIELTESDRCNLLSIRAVLAGKRPIYNAEILTLDRILAEPGAKP